MRALQRHTPLWKHAVQGPRKCPTHILPRSVSPVSQPVALWSALRCSRQGGTARLWKDARCPQSCERVLPVGRADTAALSDLQGLGGAPGARHGASLARGWPGLEAGDTPHGSPLEGGQMALKVCRHRARREAGLLSALSPSLPAAWASGREFWNALQSGKMYETGLGLGCHSRQEQ